jgi:hypothetical protein
MTTKTYTTRDSATSLLRKLGIDKSDYGKFIKPATHQDSAIFIVDITAAEQHLSGKPSVAVPAVPKKKPASVPTTPTDTKKPLKGTTPRETKHDTTRRGKHDRGRTVSSVARELILQGLDNNAVFAKLVDEFKLDADKKYYPAWYRSELRGKGLLPKK